jgi:hypothetical protein
MKRTLKAFAFHLAVIAGVSSRLPKLHKQKSRYTFVVQAPF